MGIGIALVRFDGQDGLTFTRLAVRPDNVLVDVYDGFHFVSPLKPWLIDVSLSILDTVEGLTVDVTQIYIIDRLIVKLY